VPRRRAGDAAAVPALRREPGARERDRRDGCLGLAPRLVGRIFEAITAINRRGVTVLVVEQNAHRALPLSEHTYVLDTGRVVLAGPSARLIADPRIKESYLGER
jgi:ABC-type branched-subunit amino acid transport system ATPase component